LLESDLKDILTSKSKSYTSDEFQDLCFNYGIELDEDVNYCPLPVGDTKGISDHL